MRLNDGYILKYRSEKEKYNNFFTGGKTKIDGGDIPDREDFKSIYIFLVNLFKKDILHESEYNINKLQNKYYEFSNKIQSHFKFRIVIDIFNETDIIYAEHDFDSIQKIKINNKSDKTNLDNSKIYEKLKELR
jgi:ssDNA-specific exonuclease RecJ